MFKSIQQFEEGGINNLQKVEKEFISTKDMAGLVTGITREVMNLGIGIIEETLEYYDEVIRQRAERKEKWQVVRRDRKSLITSLGTVQYYKTLYKDKKTGECCYLLDSNLGLDDHQRMTEDAEAKLLEEAVQTSYRKGGEAVSLLDNVSKETVMNKIHALDFSRIRKDKPEKKRAVKYLYIDADEDHASLQYNTCKGDLKISDYGRKNNCIPTKMVYVYEGIEKEAPESQRKKLVGARYFCGVYSGGLENQRLWQEVYDYMEANYDLGQVKKVYLNSDGGGWIRNAGGRIHGLTRVLDEFHLEKYLLKMTGHMQDSADDARRELVNAIRHGSREDFGRIAEKLIGYGESDREKQRIAESANYILSNWSASKVRLQRGSTVIGCSAEGHVSHVLSDRMSSRPLGWCREGADKMARLRAYYFNHGDMLELVKAQALPKAAGCENDIILKPSLVENESLYPLWGKYVEHANHSVSIQGQKLAWLAAQIDYI